MREPIDSRLMLGGALVAFVALGAVAMRAALPEPPQATTRATTPPAVTSSRQAFEPEPSDPVMTPDPWVVVAEPIPRTDANVPAPVTTRTRDQSACDGDYLATCPDELPKLASRPMVGSDAAPLARTTTSRTSRPERRVSTGPMRMLGGGESSW